MFLGGVLVDGILLETAGGTFLGGVLADGLLLDTAVRAFPVIEVLWTGTPVMSL